MLLLQFVFFIVDSALYLRRNLLGKIIFQFISVVEMHVWLLFLVPMFSERSLNIKFSPVMYYGFKYLYLLLSAYQIRCGYPKKIKTLDTYIYVWEWERETKGMRDWLNEWMYLYIYMRNSLPLLPRQQICLSYIFL